MIKTYISQNPYHFCVFFYFILLILLCFALQWGLLPGHNHRHGPHYEHVHSGAVWRYCHGEYQTLTLLFLSVALTIGEDIVQIQHANAIQM